MQHSNALEAVVRRIRSARDFMLEVEISLPGKSITFGILQQYLVSTSRKKGLASVVQAIHGRLPGISTKRDLYMQSLMPLITTGKGVGMGMGVT